VYSDHATLLLRSARDDAALHALLATLGFPSPPLALDDTARERLGLPDTTESASVARGDGVLRALVIDIAPHTSIRDTIALIARRLATRTPQLLWLVIVRSHDTGALAIATWLGGSTPRLAALTTDPEHVTASDAETLCALAGAATTTPDGVRHLRWFDALGRESVTRRFFVALRTAITAMTDAISHVPDEAAREIALLSACRLLFLSFLETKGWLAGDYAFLTNAFAGCMARGGGFHRKVLEPLFFGTLNTPLRDRAPRARSFGAIPFLNGGLFTRTIVEKRFRYARFPDDALGTLFGDVLVRYRFTPRETSSTTWSESTIDPEILGKTFESLMAADDRRRHGVFYTPHSYVERLVSLALVPTLSSDANDAALIECALRGERIDAATSDRLRERVTRIRILDPACGSGAFLVHLLDRLATLRATLGDDRPIAAIRRSVLETSIHGVDVSPTAVWLCQLRLWLATVIDADVASPMQVRPLPNLDRQIRVGDSLAGDGFEADGSCSHGASGPRIAPLRRRYVSATGRRKTTLARALDVAERQRARTLLEHELTTLRAQRMDIIAHARSADFFRTRHGLGAATRRRLSELRTSCRALRARLTALQRGAALPFSYAAHFADVADAGGFDAIVGNPPWVRIHNIPAADRTRFREHFTVLRSPAWATGADACAGRGFGSQGDLAAPFVERSIELLRPGGVVALLLPAKIWRSLAGGGLRRFVAEHASLHALEDHSEARPEFDAAVYPSLFVAERMKPREREAPTTTATIEAAAHSGDSVRHWRLPATRLAYDSTSGAPWLLVPGDVRASFDALREAGIPLAASSFGRPWLGVKSGCNAPFIVRASEEGDPARVTSGEASGCVERALLRPVLRGEHVSPWRSDGAGEHIVWTHGSDGAALRTLPPFAHEWLHRWRRQLERRSDARRVARWWTLFRTEAADARRARVVWNDIGRTPRATLLFPDDPTVPLNTCYVARGRTVDDALALTALLNAPIIAAWLGILAEPARGGYHRYLGWTLAALPIPRAWDRALALLAPLASAAIAGAPPLPAALDAAVLDAFGIAESVVASLVAWNDAG